jgi:hypothetical protein
MQFVFNVREQVIINLSALTITAPTVNNPHHNIIHMNAHFIMWTLLTIAKITMMKKIKMISQINFLMTLILSPLHSPTYSGWNIRVQGDSLESGELFYIWYFHYRS